MSYGLSGKGGVSKQSHDEGSMPPDVCGQGKDGGEEKASCCGNPTLLARIRDQRLGVETLGAKTKECNYQQSTNFGRLNSDAIITPPKAIFANICTTPKPSGMATQGLDCL